MATDIGIDLGTANVLIYIKGQGIVLNEPSVVAIDLDTKKPLAVGTEAREMLGRTPDNIVAVRPLKDGIIADFEATRMLVQNLVYRVVPKSLFYKPRVIITIPSNITDVEERAVEGVGYRVGAKAVYLIEEVMAAAKPAGAGGGTVFHSRRVCSEESIQMWGITIQQEREIVLILAEEEKKVAIMQAITEKCGAQSEAHGIVVSMPVDELYKNSLGDAFDVKA